MRIVCVLLIASIAWAGPGASEQKFRDAVAQQAKLDSAAGAKGLVALWDANQTEIAPLRKNVARIRAKRVKEERKLRKERDERKRTAIRIRIAELVDEYVAVDRQLSPLELRRVVLLEAIDGLKSTEAIGWLCTTGLGRIGDPLLRTAIGKLAVRTGGVDAATMRAALAQSKKPELVVPLL